MTAIKICGLHRPEDIVSVNRLNISYAGFVFTESIRKVSPDWVKEWGTRLLPGIKKVGVFVNYPLETLKEIISYCSLDVVQLHGEEPPAYCNQVGIPVWKALRVKDGASLKVMAAYDVEGFVLDGYHPSSYGGTGLTFDWSLAASIPRKHKIILAGGLNVNNVGQAIETVKPFAVDISSGVETGGQKDYGKMLDFVQKVRRSHEVCG